MFSKYAAIWLTCYGDYLIALRRYRAHPVPRMWVDVRLAAQDMHEWDIERLRAL